MHDDPVVITGIGLIASVGCDRETVWKAVREGRSGARWLEGIDGIPDRWLIGAPVDLTPVRPGELKVIHLARHAAREALEDAALDWSRIDRTRFGCAVSAHMGDTSFIPHLFRPGPIPDIPHIQIPYVSVSGENTPFAELHLPQQQQTGWWSQWLPNTACCTLGREFGLYGPRLCHSTACASGLIEVLSAYRAIRDGQCDLALVGSADAIHPLFAAGFHKMRVLAYHEDPVQACRPFDAARNGFIMGEGAGMFVLERLSHARRRGARIYAQILGGKTIADAYHVTGLDVDSESLAYLIQATLRSAGLQPSDISYINAHGTGTQQNDTMETRGIRRALGPAAQRVSVSSTKAVLGHLVNAAGSVELGVTILALRDGFVPPTMNLTHPDPECDLDCTPLVGRRFGGEYALKFSVGFGGHQAAIALRRWPEVQSQLDALARAA
ncbi:MAG TPA: beta-ketoacyl-[acyl-carrier-protein] synthase family protein [Thermoguttaceae bacterium]|nr:beta-ketoacyl-[acyl-carrier-protein] synthase family protein [Thermoguttaceae bacterium]HPP52556.1 beta-ketoacyl-[acyl-carrier-protein] synthase family protein [Thermoguttaceae bacterium]